MTQDASLEMDMPLHEIPMRDRILDALIHSGQDAWISGEKLSAAFGISRAAVSKHMMTLREEGNIIESLPHRGYRMISRADPWAGEDISAGLHTRCLGQSRWIWLKETGSTNQVAAEAALDGAEAGLVVVARRQNEGRGSKGHHWVHLPGSLCFSVLMRPECSPVDLPTIPPLIMDACAGAVLRCGGPELECSLPNDLRLQGRKAGGILVESMFYNDMMQWMVAGIGMNVNVPAAAFPPELRDTASSLYAETGRPFSIVGLMKRILEELESKFRM